MKNYLQLQQFQPGDSRVNFAPVQNALEAYGNKTMQFGQIQRQQEDQQYQRGREAKQDARQEETFNQQRAESLAKRMYAYSNVPPEQRNPQTWGALVKEFQRYNPGSGMDPEDMDPIKGPEIFGRSYAAAYGGIATDPMDAKIKEADLAYKKAQTSKLYADAKDVGGDYGKTGTTVQGPDGKFYTVRYKSDGTHTIQPLEFNGQAVTPDRGTDVVGDTIINKSTGQEVRNVGPTIAAGERQKVVGREMGERQMGAPKAAAALESANVKSDVLIDTIARARQLVGPMTTGLPGAALSNLPGTAARDLRALTDTLKANAGFQELQTMRDNSPTGGALGQVAVQELAMLQSTITSLEQAQTAAQFSQALDNFEKFVVGSKERRKAAYDATYGGAQQPQTQPTPQPASRQAPPQAVQMLRADPSPEAIREFNEVFGPGAAEGVLNGR